ncbi:MAG: cyclase family protein [Blastocatellia bacterium]|nr:cyclase family protein [Blastocatellia bacterium]
MDEILSRKLAAINQESVPTVRLADGIDLSSPPGHPRISFPAPGYTPVFEVLNRTTLASSLGIQPDLISGLVSELVDVSSHPAGVCLVSANLYLRSNAHAGSHADQPAHWLAQPPFSEFDNRQYNGPVTILNLAALLEKSGKSVITVPLLEHIANETGFDWQTAKRVLLRTYHQTPTIWEDTFAHLSPAAGEFLGTLPHLLLFGTDAPSVDHPAASPIIACAHGGLWAGRVAILEGLETDRLPTTLRLDGLLQVLWNPMQIFPDAKGALVTFFRTED